MITTIAEHQIRSLRRQRIFMALLITLLTMTALAGVIGWSSHRTIVRVYDDSVALLAAEGKPAPPNPFELKPRLALVANMVIYIPLIGALLALVLGHLSVADDRSNGIGRLIFARQIPRRDYTLGKIAAAGVVLAAILLISTVVSLVSLLIIDRSFPPAQALGQLLLFYGVSWTYLMTFALIGMVPVLLTGRRSLALLWSLGVWMVVTFVMPQFTSGLHPSASLNPITDPVSTSQRFFQYTAHIRPFSISEQYKLVGTTLLDTRPSEPWGETVVRLLPILGLAGLLALATIQLVARQDYSRSGDGE